ncbi:MAG: hypothetical protein NC433_07535 [Clostridiales bacterium]|nr:hypothetical protein [Clostridiales bacterium]
MENKGNNLIEMLDEADLAIACKYADLDPMIAKLRRHPEYYKKYIVKINGGNLDKKSSVVKELLPRTILKLYKKNDKGCKDVLETILQSYKKWFVESLMASEPEISLERIVLYSSEEMADLYFKIGRYSRSELPIELFLLHLKLQYIELSEDSKKQIASIIEHKKQIHEIEKQFEAKKNKEVRQIQKQISEQFEEERKKQNHEYIKCQFSLYEAKDRIKELEEKLVGLQRQLDENKESLVEAWQKTFDAESEKKRQLQDQELLKIRTEKIAQIEKECFEKKQIGEKELEEYFSNLRNGRAKDISELDQEIQLYRAEYASIEEEIKVLQSRRTELQESVEKIEEYVESYFADFDRKILEKRIDSIIGTKFNTSFGNKLNGKVQKETTNYFIGQEKKIDNNTEIVKANDLEDLHTDLKDNLALEFDENCEISSIILATVLNKKALIMCDSIGEKVISNLSFLINACMPAVLQVGAGKTNLSEILNAIKRLDSDIIYINGVLDNYDEIAFEIICRECSEKIVCFGIAELSKLKTMSKSIFNHAIVLDIEKYIHFPIRENIFIGNQNIFEFSLESNENLCMSYWKKYFQKLTASGFIGKKLSLDLSRMLQTYYALQSGETLGIIMQDIIFKMCDCEDFKAEELKKTLKKCGIDFTEE